MLQYEHLAQGVKKSIVNQISRINSSLSPTQIKQIAEILQKSFNCQDNILQDKKRVLLTSYVNNTAFAILWKSQGGYGIEEYVRGEINPEYIKKRMQNSYNFWMFADRAQAEEFLEKEKDIDLEQEVQEQIKTENMNVTVQGTAAKLNRETVALKVLIAQIGEKGLLPDKEVEEAFEYADEFMKQAIGITPDETQEPAEEPPQIIPDEKLIDN